jgi:hypothetical protein
MYLQEALIEDFARNHDHDAAVNQALHDIDRVLRENGSSCATIGLPPPQGEVSDEQPSPLEPAPTFDDLTDEQQHLVDRVLQSISPSGVEGESVPKLQADVISEVIQHESGMRSMDWYSNHPHDQWTYSAQPLQAASTSP